MKNLVIITVFVFIFSLSCASQSQNQAKEKDYIIGQTDINYIRPKNVTFTYASKLFENEIFRVEYTDNNQSFRIFKNKQNIEIPDKIFSKLKISPYGFDLKEYYNHLGTDAPPMECQTLFFDVVDHDSVTRGHYQMCTTEKSVLRLQSDTSYPLDGRVTIYDSSVSDKIHPDGIWEEVWQSETSTKK